MLSDFLCITKYIIRGVPERVDCAVAYKLGTRSLMKNDQITVDNIVYNKQRETTIHSETRRG